MKLDAKKIVLLPPYILGPSRAKSSPRDTFLKMFGKERIFENLEKFEKTFAKLSLLL